MLMPPSRGWPLGTRCVQCGHSWSTVRRAPVRCPKCGSRRWRLHEDLERTVAFRTPYTIVRVMRTRSPVVAVELRQGLSPYRARVELEGRLQARLRASAREIGLSITRLTGCQLHFERNADGGTEVVLARPSPFDLH